MNVGTKGSFTPGAGGAVGGQGWLALLLALLLTGTAVAQEQTDPEEAGSMAPPAELGDALDEAGSEGESTDADSVSFTPEAAVSSLASSPPAL